MVILCNSLTRRGISCNALLCYVMMSRLKTYHLQHRNSIVSIALVIVLNDDGNDDVMLCIYLVSMSSKCRHLRSVIACVGGDKRLLSLIGIAIAIQFMDHAGIVYGLNPFSRMKRGNPHILRQFIGTKCIANEAS